LDARRRHKRALIEWANNQTGDAVEQALRAKEAEARAHRDKVLQRVAAEDKTNATVLSAFACKPRQPPTAPLLPQMKKLQAGVREAALHKQSSKGGAKRFLLGAGAGGDVATPAAGNATTPAAAAAPAAAAGGAGAGAGAGSMGRLFAKRASAKAKEEESAAPAAAPAAAADFKRGGIGRKSCAQMRRDAKAAAAVVAKAGGSRGPAGDDAIDNELLVTALAKDMLGEGLHEGEASQMAELYAKNARAHLEA